MNERCNEVRFHGAQPVGRRYKVSGSKSPYFGGKEFLGLEIEQRVAEHKVKGVIREPTSAGVGNNAAQEASHVISSWTDIEHGDLGKRKAFGKGQVPEECPPPMSNPPALSFTFNSR
jgi:hypothetical protein